MQVLSTNVHRQSCPEKIKARENRLSIRFVERGKKCLQQFVQPLMIIAEQLFNGL